MATLAQLLTRTRDRLDEDSAVRWTEAKLRRWISDGLREVARRTETLQAISTAIPAVAGTQSYTAPTDALRIYRVEYVPTGSTTRYTLEYMDYNTIDSIGGSNFASTRGTPSIFLLWGFPPTLSIILYPTPSVGGTLRIYYYRLPAALADDGTDDSDTVEIPAGYEDLAVDYAEYNALRADRDPRWQEAKALFEQHVEALGDTTRRWSDQVGSFGVDVPLGLPAWLLDADAY